VTRAIFASLLLWPAYLALFLALLLVGFVVVPVAAYLRWYYWLDDAVFWTPRWLAPWDNLEHGIAGPASYQPDISLPWRIVSWSAFRNPVNGLRFMFGIMADARRIRHVGNSLDPETDAMHEPGRTFWAFTWQGPLAGYKRARARGRIMTETWIGWKFLPKDAFGVHDWRTHDVGFAVQPFLRWKF